MRRYKVTTPSSLTNNDNYVETNKVKKEKKER